MGPPGMAGFGFHLFRTETIIQKHVNNIHEISLIFMKFHEMIIPT